MPNNIPIVVENTPQGERSYDLYSRLMRDRIIMLDTQINEHTASILVAQLLFLESDDPAADILFYINSPGGSVTAGISIYDTMNFIKPDVSTVIMGQAASMGSLLAMAGAPGKRLMLPHSRHMIHQPLGGFSGQVTDIEIHAAEIVQWKKTLTQLYADHTRVSIDQLRDDMERDNFMSAEESVTYGLADEIITKR